MAQIQAFDSIEAYVQAAKTFEEYDVGERYTTKGRTITHSDIRLFNGATDGTHPNHVDAEYAESHPLVEGVVAQGVLVLGVVDGFVVDEFSEDAAFGLNYGFDKIRFLDPVHVGDTVSGTIEIVDRTERSAGWGVIDLDIEISNQDGDIVLFARNRQLVATSDLRAEDLEGEAGGEDDGHGDGGDHSDGDGDSAAGSTGTGG